ncbi:23896_t:CDS:2, partial [Dentiscutata erythropus]
VLSQDSCHLLPTKPKTIIGYYLAYKPNNLIPDTDFDISPSINYLNYIAFGLNDLVNNNNSTYNDFGKLSYKIFTEQFSKFNELSSYKAEKNLTSKAFHLNINNTYASAGINKITQIWSSWNDYIDNSKLVLGVEFGGIVEIVFSNNIKSDIENQCLQTVNNSTSTLSKTDE